MYLSHMALIGISRLKFNRQILRASGSIAHAICYGVYDKREPMTSEGL